MHFLAERLTGGGEENRADRDGDLASGPRSISSCSESNADAPLAELAFVDVCPIELL